VLGLKIRINYVYGEGGGWLDFFYKVINVYFSLRQRPVTAMKFLALWFSLTTEHSPNLCLGFDISRDEWGGCVYLEGGKGWSM
jgi:hypothetical protein